VTPWTPGGEVVKNPHAVQEMEEIWVQSLGEKIPQRRKWLQYSHQENSKDRGV